MLKRLNEIKNTLAFNAGIVSLDGYHFHNLEEIAIFLQWLGQFKHIIHLSLKNCGIGENQREISDVSGGENDKTYVIYKTIANTNPRGFVTTRAEHLSQIFYLPGLKLRSIDLSNNNLVASESLALLRAILPSQKALRSLSFTLNNLNLECLCLLSKFLQEDECVLKYLSLERCFLLSKIPFLLHFKDALKKNTSLRKLDLSNNEVKEQDLVQFVTQLEKNESIVDIKLTLNTITPDTSLRLSKLLARNRDSQKDIHDKLLARDELSLEAERAIQNDDYIKLDVLLGVNQGAHTEAVIFTKKYTHCFYRLIEAKTHLRFLTAQHKTIQKVVNTNSKSSTYLRDLQQELVNVITDEKHRAEQEFKYAYKRFCGDLPPLPPTVIANENEDEALRRYQTEILIPITQQDKVILDHHKPLSLIADKLNSDIISTQAGVTKLTQENALLLCQHQNYIAERQRLTTTLQSIAPPTIQREFEEIKDAYIESAISPEQVDAIGMTLTYKAFIQNKLNCFSMLLARQGSILKTNADGNCVFFELMSRPQNQATHLHAVAHIEKMLESGWSCLNEVERVKLKEIREIFAEYLSIFSTYKRLQKVNVMVSAGPIQATTRLPQTSSINPYHDMNLIAQALYNLLALFEQATPSGFTYQNDPISQQIAQFLQQTDTNRLRSYITTMQSRSKSPYDQLRTQQVVRVLRTYPANRQDTSPPNEAGISSTQPQMGLLRCPDGQSDVFFTYYMRESQRMNTSPVDLIQEPLPLTMKT